MKHSLWLCLAILAMTSTASAEKIYCYFNEPSVKTTYDSDTNEFTIEALGSSPQTLTGHVVFGAGILKISDTGLMHFLEVNTMKEGSDGMSDFKYPYHGTLMGKYSNPQGGCETDHVKKYQ
ncbi:hypothetical protein [Bdellovibrio sp. HCB337]|uniref:hypothetical protein n=1 Tax=Bdellovibrio sp. HCB337 TaxID=3394358 RepID=UPI0039A41BC2